jgi:NTP pyrophosphatase (non-canonical NTP hydrolase)
MTEPLPVHLRQCADRVPNEPCICEELREPADCFEQYQRDVVRTLALNPDPNMQLAILALGLTGESGEAADIIKKVVGHGHPLDETVMLKLLAELGDILWYIAAIAHVLDLPLETIVTYNVEKLAKRYPEGFSTERSINRGA